jgi:hypothetical protein
VETQRSGLGGQFIGKHSVIYVNADAGHDGRLMDLHQDSRHLSLAEHQVIGPAQIALDIGRSGDGFGGGESECHGENRHGILRQRGPQHQRNVETASRLGMPDMTVSAHDVSLFFGQNCRAMGIAGRCEPNGFAHRGIDDVEVSDTAAGQALPDEAKIQRLHTSSSQKLISVARAEWVMAPEETKSAPVCA